MKVPNVTKINKFVRSCCFKKFIQQLTVFQEKNFKPERSLTFPNRTYHRRPILFLLSLRVRNLYVQIYVS